LLQVNAQQRQPATQPTRKKDGGGKGDTSGEF
jgi:hypothetical protein